MKKGYIYILFSTIFFSTAEIALKMATGVFNPIQLTFLRFFIGSIVLLPIALKGIKSRNYRLKSADFAFFALTGFLCVVVSMILYQMAIVYAKASVVAVLFCCNPVFVILFAFLMLHEKIYRYTIASLVVTIVGILFIMNPFHINGKPAGIILSILSAVTFALYNIVGRTRSSNFGGTALTCFSFLFGSAELLVLMLLTRLDGVAAFFQKSGMDNFVRIPIVRGISLGTLPSLIYAGIFVTGLGFAFYFLAMEETSAATASLVFFIKPALAPALAFLILHETITLNMGAGIVLMLVGSAISLIPGFRLRKGKGLKEDLKEDMEEAEHEIEAEIDETSLKP